MATHTIDIVDFSALPESGRFIGPISAELTLANADIGERQCLVLAEDAADSGWGSGFEVPVNFVGSAVVRVKGILDGAPGASDVLAITYQHLALADNEAADAAFQTADLGSATIGSSGSAHSDEDLIILDITLSNNTMSASEWVAYHFRIDISVNTYAGNLLVTKLILEYSDA